MSPERTSALLLRLYPAGWRARYGDELEALILESSGARVSWRTRMDVALAAGRERLRAAGLAGDGAPEERMRSGSLLVLAAWALFVIAGCGVQKFSEHWQDTTPHASRALPSGAFDALVAAAAVGTVLVLIGIAATLPSLARFLRDGGWLFIRRRITLAAAATVVTVGVTVALVAWARGLTLEQRDGNDVAYGALFIVWVALLAVCVGAWTAAAAATARRLDLSPAVVTLEAGLGGAVALAMAVMTASTAVWWGALARAAPWVLAGTPVGSNGAVLPAQMLFLSMLMVLATAAAVAGAVRALRAMAA